MRTIQFYAYHGTILEFANRIKETKNFIFGDSRKDHWLGVGSYFFREDEEQAKLWAELKASRHLAYKGKDTAVVEVNVNVTTDKVLNLDTRKGVLDLIEFIDKLKTEGIQLKIPSIKLKEQTPELACKVFSLIDPLNKWVIIRTFQVQSKFIDKNKSLQSLSFKFRNSMITYSQQGTQVCVKNNEAIKKESIKLLYKSNNKSKMIKRVTKEEISDEYFNK